MIRSTHTPLPSYQSHLTTFMHRLQRRHEGFHSASVSELLQGVEQANIPGALNRRVNDIQKRLWRLSAVEQAAVRAQLIQILKTHVVSASSSALCLAAASWLRFFVQAGLVVDPQEIFVTLVTKSKLTAVNSNVKKHERRAYLKTLFDCFWPFRHPYPAYSWQMLPSNEIFYPLATQLNTVDEETQDILISIFSELPALDDALILEHLLPVALTWAEHSDMEHRSRAIHLLARMHVDSAQLALQDLSSDPDPLVRADAREALSSSH